jgi:hypothetical protein
MGWFAQWRKTVASCSLAAMMVGGLASTAVAQAGGVRAGVSANPDQFYVGAHLETAALVDRLHFKPNVEVGFGEDVTLVAGNLEFVYKFRRSGAWGIYAGGGPAINFYSADDDSDAEPGFNLLFGVEAARGLFFEAKFGLIDSPDFKFGVGWTFR